MSDPSRRTRRGTGSLITPDTSDETEPLFGVISARFRTASPDLPRLPLWQARVVLPAAVNQASAVIHEKTIEKLQKFRLLDEETEIDVGMYGTYGQSDVCCPTVLIVTKWDPNREQVRVKAVQEIVKFATLEVRSRDQAFGSIQVDMIDPQLINKVFYGPIRNQPQLFNRWDQMRALVLERLQSFPASRGQMTAIFLFHYGINERYTENPITIYVSVGYDCLEFWWPEIIKDIQQNLANRGLPVLNVHIEHNIGSQMAFDYVQPLGDKQVIQKNIKDNNLFLKHPYQTLVSLGDPIGAARYIKLSGQKKNPVTGTLGCYVELKTAQNQTWEVYALTNYHVVRPTIDGFQLKLNSNGKTALRSPQQPSKLWKADEDGLRPGTSVPSEMMESPTRAKHNHTLWMHKERIAEVDALAHQDAASTQRKQEAKQALNSKIAFFDTYSHIFGKVYAGSGYKHRSVENNRLDWALIRVNRNRIGTNDLPGPNAWNHMYLGQPTNTFGRRLRNPTQSISQNASQPCINVFKLGSTSGATAGVFHEVKIDVKINDDKHLKLPPSSEYVFQPQGGPEFALPGDSGAAVYDDQGCIVGLLFTGQVPINGSHSGIGYVTPIEYVFNDIMDTFKGQITDIRVANR
ncbi:hypothetical protein ACHAO7_003516 [Fusarium culmorum]